MENIGDDELKVLKSILALIIIAAIAAGIFLFLNNKDQGKGAQSAPVSGETLVINEFLSSNSAVLPDDKGKYSDWIEIYNPTANDINLAGIGLSDDKTKAKWTFPSLMLPGKGYIVVFASGDDIKDPDAPCQHTNFKLSISGGSVYIFDAEGKPVDNIDYTEQTENISLGRDPANLSQLQYFDKPTPGFSNDDSGYAAFQESRKARQSDLLITELMPSNTETFADNKGDYNDYIEIYNAGGEPINLKDYGLSDDPEKVLKWKLPDIVIEPGGYLVVFASGEDTEGTDMAAKSVHTNFRLAAYKETIVLSDPKGYILDQASYKEIPEGKAYVRAIDADGVYQQQWEPSNPSPGSKNG